MREALQNLQAEGLVESSPTGGFVVTRLSADELARIYPMRRLLETGVLRRAGIPGAGEAAALAAHGRPIDALGRGATGELAGHTDGHRGGSERDVVSILPYPPGAPGRPISGDTGQE